MQNPPTFPACYPVLSRGRFILKANHSTTNGDIAKRNTTQACGKKGKGEYRNLVPAAVFCSYETGAQSYSRTGKTWWSLLHIAGKDNTLGRSKIRMRNIEEDILFARDARARTRRNKR